FMAMLCWSTAGRLAAAGQKPPALPGTHWHLLSLTGKGEKITDAQNPADVEFLKDGKWGILHYGGSREAGTFQVTANRLVMKNETGELYFDGKMTWKPDTKTLEVNSGQDLMRLRQFQPK